jgi:hypothetical protein
MSLLISDKKGIEVAAINAFFALALLESLLYFHLSSISISTEKASGFWPS